MEKEKDINRVEILQHLSQVNRAQISQHKEYEWKTLISTLGVFGLSAAAKLAGNVVIPNDTLFLILVWVAFITLAVISSAYLYHIHLNQQINKRYVEESEQELVQLSKSFGLEKIGKETEGMIGRRPWSLIWHFVTIFLFCLAAAYVITLN